MMNSLGKIHLQIDELTVLRNYRKVFAPASFTLENHQSLYIKGVNGAGKTTLLRVLAGINNSYQGTLILNDLERREWLHEYSKNCTYIGHLLGLKEDLTALENIQSTLAIRKKKRTSKEILALFETLSIPTQSRALRFLSAGQKRRVALSRLWLEETPLWVLDEPFTALDLESIALLEAKMVTHQKAGGLIIFTSHQLPTNNVYTHQFLLEPFA